MVRSINKAGLVLMLVIFSLMLASCGGGGGGGGGVTGGGGTLPAKPTGLTAAVSSNLVTLTWNASANATGYRIYRSSSSGLSKATGTFMGTIINTSFNDPAANNATYYYVVTALNGVYESASSAEVSARLTPPVAPETVLATAGNGSVSLSWSDNPNTTSYRVYRSLVSGGSYTAISSGLLATAVTDTLVTNDTLYYYVVTGTNAFGEGPQSPETAATPTSSATGTTTISGVITYEDREYDQFLGHNGNTAFKAVRFADVELWNASSDSNIATGATGTAGAYSISVSSAAVNGVTAYIRVISTATLATGQVINVRTVSTSPQLYAVNSSNFIPTGNTTVNLSIPVTNTADSAFNILDAMTSGFQMINSASAPTIHALTLNTHWQPNNTNAGSYSTFYCDQLDYTYCPGGAGIYVMSAPFGIYQDTDDFDDDVLWHELGHYISDKLSNDQSPGGTHYLNVNTQDMRLSWSEGWGNFFQTAVKDWLNANQPTLLSTPVTGTLSEYVDTEIGGYYISMNISTPETGGVEIYCINDECKYSTNEISVANVLWKLMFAAGSGGFGFQPIWNVVNNYLPSVSASTPINIETFWNGWKTQRSAEFAAEKTALELTYGNRNIYYREDAFEAAGDDDYSTARIVTLPFAETHYLYKDNSADDVDYVGFAAAEGASYTISTTMKDTLKNGGDTVISIYDTDGTTLLAVSGNPNDNYNNFRYSTCDQYGNNCPINGDVYVRNSSLMQYVWSAPAPLSSKITFNAPSTRTYYVAVRNASGTVRPASAGRYGTYKLTITSP